MNLDLLNENEEFIILSLQNDESDILEAKKKEGKIIANNIIIKILGYTKEELKSIDFKKLIYPDDLIKYKYILNAFLKGKIKDLNLELRLITKSKEYVWVNLHNIPTKNEKYIYYLLSYNDKKVFENIIREQREEIVHNQEEIEFNKLKNKFFINISHEFNTPLNLIFSSLDLIDLYLKKNVFCNKNKLQMPLSTIRQNANRLSRLVQNLIDITKMDVNDYHLNMEICDIVSLINNIYNSVKKHMEEKERKFIYKKKIDYLEIKCDPVNLERILLNLLSNSIKFSNKGDQISLNLSEDEENVYITVKDTGIGIEKEKQKCIFKPFRQANESLTRSAEGSGIGLSIAKCLVEMHGGEIQLRSEHGKGSEFIISIPKNNDSYLNEKYDVVIKDDFSNQVEIEFSDIYT
ncbi:sensor histidine kinase [Natronospora cellulosivora (SeqCode)]